MSKRKKLKKLKENFIVLVESKSKLDDTKLIYTNRENAVEIMEGFEIAMSEQPGFDRGWNFIVTNTTRVTMIRTKDFSFLGGFDNDDYDDDDDDEEEDKESFNPFFDILNGKNIKRKEYDGLVREFYSRKNGKDNENGKESK